jgi:hypothetical protein
LPRLLALADPLLPIVIFSSSTQRTLADRLWPCGNIILDFAKPAFFGGPKEFLISDAIAKLGTALDKATVLGRARARLIALAKLPDARPRETMASKGSFVEVYVEESGSGDALAVGGLVAVYPSAKAASEFSSVLRGAGILWGKDCDAPFLPAPTTYLTKASSARDSEGVRNILRHVADLATQHGVSLAAFMLGPVKIEKDEFLLWRGPDALYRHLLGQAIETLLFDWLPDRALAKAGSPLHLYAATRLLAGNGQDLILLQRKFGVDLRDFSDRRQNDGFCRILTPEELAAQWQTGSDKIGFLNVPGNRDLVAVMPVARDNFARIPGGEQAKIRAYSFSFDDFYPIIRETFAQRARSLPVARAVGVGFSYYGGFSRVLKPHQLPRQIHYAADYVVSRPDACPEAWWQDGFREQADERFNRLVEVSRALDQGDSPRALLAWSRYSDLEPGHHRNTAQCVGKRLNAQTPKITGPELLKFARSL